MHKNQNPNTPDWLQIIIQEVNTRIFLADDFHEEDMLDCMPMSKLEEAEFTYSDLMNLEDETSFPHELSRLIRERWTGTKREFCEQALILENTFYKIQSGERYPSRDTAISLALALKLTPKQAGHFLGYLGYGLSDHIKRDWIVLKCLEQKKSPLEVNLVFETCNLRLLGPEK